MLNSAAIQREFQPRYSFSWYMSKLFIVFIAAAYITSKVLGEDTRGMIEVLGIGALLMLAYSTAFTLKTVELGTKLKLRYVFWPARDVEYKTILEVRLPEIALESKGPIKFEQIVNLEELQQEFKSLELMGVIRRGCIKELQPPPSKYTFKPRLGNILWALLTVLVLGQDWFRISREVNFLWAGIMAIYFASEVFNRLFGKPKDE